MGAWGVTSFENDSALDWLSVFEEERDLSQVVITVYEFVNEYKEDEFVDSGISSELIAAAEVVAALFGSPCSDLPPEMVKWIKKKQSYDRSLISIFNKIVIIIFTKEEVNKVWKEKSKEQKWNFSLNLLSEIVIDQLSRLIEKSELNELWKSSDKYEKWIEEITDLMNRCRRKQ
ncbi:DUF4259 domain-containing protein [Cohnella sp. GCM10027633]|uniref:DUF4259 domain-containing protein n=1 Tax=unclassified Cohnella TaxID=2636738 RepID=UPI003635792F